jgi:hypothetical protein
MTPPPHRKITPGNRLVLAVVIVAILVLAVALIPGLGLGNSHPQRHRSAGGATPSVPTSSAVRPSDGPRVCGQPILDSPYGYTGKAGPYSSGTAGLPTYGTPSSDFPRDTAGVALPTGTNNYLSYQLKPDTVYYLLPGTHSGGIQADHNDAFVGGRSGRTVTVLDGNYSPGGQAIDSNSTDGDQAGVTIEYLTIERYRPDADAAAVNQEANTGWNIRYNTITLNVPGAGVITGAENTLADNCLTLNGQYGFQSSDTNGFGHDPLTGGPYDVTVEQNEISYNDTCDFSGLLSNSAIGWSNHNPVPARYRNPECGKVVGDGNQGGFKLWQTDGVTITDNSVHDNWGPGGWADTNNANTTWAGNSFIGNEGAAIIEEISYNFSITDNYMADNDWTDGLNNSTFPQPAIYISESGSDSTFGGVPGCQQASCAHQKSYTAQSVISGNKLVDNGGGIFLWQNSNRYCTDGYDGPCTLVGGRQSGPFTTGRCKVNIRSASVSTVTYAGHRTGSPPEDWWDGCMWRTENVKITGNVIDFNPAHILDCNQAAWPDCGANGLFSEYGSPPSRQPDWAVPTELTFFQNNTWFGNTYRGPSPFFAWNQGNDDNPVSWADWTGSVPDGDKCSSGSERQSGYCTGPFGQDAGSAYNSSPTG